MFFVLKNNMAAKGSAREQIAENGSRMCGNEIALQRSGDNSSLLMRTQDLIANSARSACREVKRPLRTVSLNCQSTAAVNLLCHDNNNNLAESKEYCLFIFTQ